MHSIVVMRKKICLKTTAFATYETLSWEFFNIFGFYADAVVSWILQVVHCPEVGITFVIGTDYSWKNILSFCFSFLWFTALVPGRAAIPYRYIVGVNGVVIIGNVKLRTWCLCGTWCWWCCFLKSQTRRNHNLCVGHIGCIVATIPWMVWIWPMQIWAKRGDDMTLKTAMQLKLEHEFSPKLGCVLKSSFLPIEQLTENW